MRLFRKLRYAIPIPLLILAAFLLYYFGIFGPHLSLSKTSFNHLPEWQTDNQADAFQAFKQSCVEILKRNPNAPFSPLHKAGLVKDWQPICLAALKLKKPDKIAAQKFFETWFNPYLVKNNFNRKGLFTGYYLPLLQASLTKDKNYSVPIYGFPSDLVKVNLGLFKSTLTNYTVTGQIKNNLLFPYPDRAAISQGAIKKTAPVIAWSNNAVDVFFAQVQGSAILSLPNHQQLMIGYATDNGYPYTAIGKVLIQAHALRSSEVSMQTIRDWLVKHPEQINIILNHDASYVFFKILKNNAPIGIEQVPLTPNRSLAVDMHYIPLGAPIWLDTKIPNPNPRLNHSSFRHLLIAQDTGGAIKGVIRGDIYFGAGSDAIFLAGHMNQLGRYWILLPK